MGCKCSIPERIDHTNIVQENNGSLAQLTIEQAIENPFHSCIGYFQITKGSGFLLAPNIVVTTAYNIYGLKGINASFKIVLNQSIITRKIIFTYIPQQYTDLNDRSQIYLDYALVLIEPIQKEYRRWFKFPKISLQRELHLKGQIWIYVYLSLTQENTKLFGGKGTIFKSSQNSIQYADIMTCPGHSGSPIFYKTKQGEFQIIGIHKGRLQQQEKVRGYAIRLSSIRNKINEWAEQEGFSIVLNQKQYTHYLRSLEEILEKWKEKLHQCMDLYKVSKEDKFKQIWEKFQHQFPSSQDMMIKLDAWKKRQYKQTDIVLSWWTFAMFHKYKSNIRNYEIQKKLYQRILKQNKNFIKIYHDLADCNMKFIRPLEKAIQQSIKCYKECISIGVYDEQEKAYYKMGELELRSKRYKQAVVCFQNTISINYQNQKAYQKLIQIYSSSENTKLFPEHEIYQYLTKDVLIKNQNVHAYNFMGKYYNQTKSFMKGKLWFQAMLKNHSYLANSLTYFQYGKSLYDTEYLQYFDAAIKALKTSLELNNKLILVNFHIGKCYFKKFNCEEALIYYQREHDLLGDDQVILRAMKEAHIRHGARSDISTLIRQQHLQKAQEIDKKIKAIWKSGVEGKLNEK